MASRPRGLLASAEPATFLDGASAHGVQPLLAHHLHQSASGVRWPDEVREPLREAARVEAIANVVRRRELQRVLAALDAVGVRGLLMKGAALAYLRYPHPALRPRCDTDLLIRHADRAAVPRVMQELGYRPWAQTSGELVMPQCTVVKEDRSGVWHAYDMHVKIANPTVFAELLSFDEAAAHSVAVPILGEPARALHPVDALLLACIHRVAHHHDSERLLWLYDIHLLASAMDRPAFERFAALAAEKRGQGRLPPGADARPALARHRGAGGRAGNAGGPRWGGTERGLRRWVSEPGGRFAVGSRGAHRVASSGPAAPPAPLSAARLHTRPIRRVRVRSPARALRTARRAGRPGVVPTSGEGLIVRPLSPAPAVTDACYRPFVRS